MSGRGRRGDEGHAEGRPGGGRAKGREIVLAREIRARGVVAGLTPAQIAAAIHDGCAAAGTSWIRAYRLALGISLADVVAQLRAWYTREGRGVPRFSETLLSAYESGQKRPGPEYLHYLCVVYRAEPPDLGYPDRCFCGRRHRDDTPVAPGTLLAGGSRAVARGAGAPRVTGVAANLPSAPSVAGGHDRGAAGAGPGGDADSGYRGAHPGGRPQAGGHPAGSGDAGESTAGLPAVVAAGADAEDDDDVLRRALLRLIADASTPADGGFFGAVDRIRRRMDDALVSGTVSATMLDQWEETAVGYGRQYMTVPPLRLLCDVLLDFGDVRRMSEHRQPLELSERLCRLAGRLAGLAGMIMIDVGDQRLARSFFRTARTAADETGDRHLRAWVTVREALVPLYYGDPGEAHDLASAGAGLAGRAPCVARAMAPVLAARSLARSASRREKESRAQALRRATGMLGQSHEALSQLPAAVRGDTAFGYTERQLLFHEGDTLVMLGHHEGADRAFRQALQLYAPEEVLDRSLVSFGLARCRLEGDEPEEALHLSLETLHKVPRAHRTGIMVRAAGSLGESVARRYGEVRGVHEYREALAST